MQWKSCKLKCKIIEYFHQTILPDIYGRVKKPNAKKVKRMSKLWQNKPLYRMAARLELTLFWSVLIQTSLLLLFKSSCSYANSLHLHEKSRGLYQSKVTSSLVCIHGQVTKHNYKMAYSIQLIAVHKQNVIFVCAI